MQMSGGRRGETDTDLRRGGHELMLTGESGRGRRGESFAFFVKAEPDPRRLSVNQVARYRVFATSTSRPRTGMDAIFHRGVRHYEVFHRRLRWPVRARHHLRE